MPTSNKKFINTKAGFTLAEMVVVAGIFTVLTAVIVFNYGDFTDNVLSTNMAYEVALTVRQAQVFGLGARGDSGEFQFAYGVFANLEDGSHSEGTQNLIFFVDNKPTDGNNQCNDSGGSGFCTCVTGDECLEKLTLQRSIYISNLQVRNSGSCSTTNRLAISFKRPDPDAIIVDQEGGGSGFELAQITIESPRNDTPRYVIIRNTGQISVEQTSACS